MNPTHVMGRRVVAFIIDGVLLTAIFAGLFLALANHTDQALSLAGTNLHVTVNNDTYYLQGGDATSFYVIELLIGLLYGGVIQGLWGRTIGKLICGIRVMREDGSRPGTGRGVLRWVLLIVDDFPYFIPMLTGFIVALSNDRRRRVGDLAAGTVVVRAAAAGAPVPEAAFAQPVAGAPPAAAPPAQPAAPQPAAPAAPPLPPANWYPDPSGQARLRYWDGARWTNHTAP
jgi:uncharacterized RDD family membrane protein YckC